jgi:hypothetical protein
MASAIGCQGSTTPESRHGSSAAGPDPAQVFEAGSPPRTVLLVGQRLFGRLEQRGAVVGVKRLRPYVPHHPRSLKLSGGSADA